MTIRLISGAAALVAMAALASTPAHAQVVTTNLVVNGGAEEGARATNASEIAPPDFPWSTSGSFTQVAYDQGGFPSRAIADRIGGGDAFFAGGPTSGFSTASQDVVISDMIDEISAGGVTARLSACLGGYQDQDDRMAVQAILYDSELTPISSILLDPVFAAQRGNRTDLLPFAKSVAVPEATRSIGVYMYAQRSTTAPQYNDAYADNIALHFNPATSAACSPKPPTSPIIQPSLPPLPLVTTDLTANPNPTCVGSTTTFTAPSGNDERDWRFYFPARKGASAEQGLPPNYTLPSTGPKATWRFGWSGVRFEGLRPVLFRRRAIVHVRYVTGPASAPVEESARRVVRFVQTDSTEPRTGCPPIHLSGSGAVKLSGPPRISPNGLVAKLRCPSPAACVGALKVTDAGRPKLVLARKGYVIPAGKSRKLKAKLTRAGRARIRRGGLATRLTIYSATAGGKLTTNTRRLTAKGG